MTRIAYLVSEYAAPSHTFVRREIAALRRRGLTILPFTIRRDATAADEEVPAVLGIPRHRLVARAVWVMLGAPRRSARTWLLAQRHCAPGLRGRLWAQFHFLEALVLAAMLREAGAERLHSHFANSGATVGMLAAQFLAIPWSLTLHGISETDPPAGGLLAGKIERAEFVVCASWFMRAQGMRVVPPAQWDKFHIVRCGIDPPVKLAEPAHGRTRTRFVTVGRISAEKGYPGLLYALCEVIAVGIDAELVIVGDGPLRGELEQSIARSGLADRVVLRGALPECETLRTVAAADVFVLASLMEGLPVVLMEAMAQGVPVIAPHLAGIPELVSDGQNGLLFRPADWDMLANCMHRLAVDAGLRERLISEAKQRIKDAFTIDEAVEPLVDLFTKEAPSAG
uniref:glycosyltransferase family 4 protein n=1 Tax=Altererythrobacter segetis TaxID=1104773 RepID=UPI001407F01D|nr:glycosyltransferase family 4 protein [Altererythrobacter segetis]